MFYVPEFKFNNKKGFTFVQTLVGISILLIIFLGLYAMFQLGMKIAAQNKARITATALANQRIETFRNLPYNQVGTLGGIPAGNIPESEVFTRNKIDFTVKTTINYIDDPFDGVAPEDDLPNDYKQVKVKTTWPGFIGGEVVLITNISPKGMESDQGGGNLSISVFDALGEPINQANIHLVNTQTDPAIDVNYQTNDQGEFLVVGAPTSTNAYQISVTKSGYSSAQTYSSDEVANPDKPHATVITGKLTEISFSIDLLGSMKVNTLSPWGSDSFNDSFFNSDYLSESEDIEIGSGQVILATSTATSSPYQLSGYLISQEIAPADILNWNELFWDDDQPLETEINYQLYYATSTDWELISDANLNGNSSGFSESPIDLSELLISEYPKLKIRGNLSTQSTSTTPTLYSWGVSWITSQATPIGNVNFNLFNQKTIGTDENEEPVYKFSEDFITDPSGEIEIADLEWGKYNFESLEEDLTLISTQPESDPIGEKIELLPEEDKSISLFLEATNSLLFDLVNTETLEPVFNAQVRLYKGVDYDQTLFTDQSGQVIFIPLESGLYNYEIQADNYENYFGSLEVLGNQIINLYLTQLGPS